MPFLHPPDPSNTPSPDRKGFCPMKEFAVTPECVRAERFSIASSCCGVLGEVTLTDSAVILLYAAMLGAGNTLAMLTTSFLPLFNGLLILPMAWFAMRAGHRKLCVRACFSASCGFFLAVCAPFFGSIAMIVFLAGILLFTLSLTGFIAGWFPLLDTFLLPGRRTLFFGRMRFFHQLSAVGFLMLAGALIGKNPPMIVLQTVLFAAGVIFCFRGVCISKIPDFPSERPSAAPSWGAGLRTAAANRPLRRFSIYLFLLNVSVFGLVPLSILYLKNEFRTPDNLLVLISGAALAGMLGGYWCGARLIAFFGPRKSFILLHLCSLSAAFGLCFIRSGSGAALLILTALLMCGNFCIAANSILASAKMMELAMPGNKTMAMAFSGMFSYGGTGLARVWTSLLLGCGWIPLNMSVFGVSFSRYQTLFALTFAAVAVSALFLPMIPDEPGKKDA